MGNKQSGAFQQHQTNVTTVKTPKNLMAQRFSETRFFRENARLFAGVTLFVWCWMLIFGFFAYKQQYSSEAMVLIKDSAITADYVSPDMGYVAKTTSSSAANPVLNTMGLLKSAEIMDALWDFFKTKHPEELKKLGITTKQQWGDFFQDGDKFIKAKNKTGTDLISIHFTWTDPKVAKEGLQVVLFAFQDASLEINRAEQKSRSVYLKAQVAEISHQLEAIRSKKSDYKQEMKTVNTLKESEELTRLRNNFDIRLNQTLAQADGKRAEMQRYSSMLGMTPDQALKASAIGMNENIKRLKGELYNLTQTHAFLSATLTDNNPKVKEVKAKIDQAQRDIQTELMQTIGKDATIATANDSNSMSVSDETRASVVKQLVTAQAEMIRMTEEANGIQARLGIIDEKIAAFPKVEEGLSNIEERERTLSESLDVLRKKMLEATLKEAQTLSNVFVVDQPRLPSGANFPNKNMLIIISVLGGLMAGVTAVVIRYQFSVDRVLGLVRRQVGMDTSDESLSPLSADEDDAALDYLFAELARSAAAEQMETSGKNPLTNTLANTLTTETNHKTTELKENEAQRLVIKQIGKTLRRYQMLHRHHPGRALSNGIEMIQSSDPITNLIADITVPLAEAEAFSQQQQQTTTNMENTGMSTSAFKNRLAQKLTEYARHQGLSDSFVDAEPNNQVTVLDETLLSNKMSRDKIKQLILAKHLAAEKAEREALSKQKAEKERNKPLVSGYRFH